MYEEKYKYIYIEICHVNIARSYTGKEKLTWPDPIPAKKKKLHS